MTINININISCQSLIFVVVLKHRPAIILPKYTELNGIEKSPNGVLREPETKPSI
jgi:hypothetical protein